MPISEDRSVTSVVRLEDSEWVLANVEHPEVVTRGLWLSAAIGEHRRELEARGAHAISWRYLIGDHITVERIARIRAAGAEVAGLRHEANELEAALRPDRDALMEDLVELHLAPSEIALVAGVPTTAIRQDLGSDEEIRLARVLLHRLNERPQP